ncbi:hypothetical protein F0U62_49615 [Cystobacter fuscus]|uniref:hypothetical protein n=1 Tax=Cystobacter fuscus TaxID=43 RepID=UPI002B2C9846|nr:hypothetical protein F0U62_49615 [Cystobacter fuscus]
MKAESTGYAFQYLRDAVEALATSSASLPERLESARTALWALKAHDGSFSEPSRTKFLAIYEQLTNVRELSSAQQQDVASEILRLFIVVVGASAKVLGLD